MGVLRILVTGGRFYSGRKHVYDALDRLHAERGILILAHGATPTGQGADWIADDWAKANSVEVSRYPVNHGADGPWPGAGPMRNRRMLQDFKPSGAVAFPGDRGTRSMVDLCIAAGVKVWWP